MLALLGDNPSESLLSALRAKGAVHSDEVISAESKTRIGDLENTLELARKE